MAASGLGGAAAPAAGSPVLGSSSYTTPRGPTSREELNIVWDYPVFERVVDEESERSSSVQARKVFTVEEALAYMAKDDPRPLLVLRECMTCSGTDDALLTRQADNEKTMLMSRWFHCVKISPDALEGDSPFTKLFPGKDPSHLFVIQRDGSGRIDLAGDQSRTELWKAMEKTLAEGYVDNPKGSLKALYGVLDEFDRIDDEIARLEKNMDDVVEKKGPKSPKVTKIKKELTKLHAKRSDLRTQAVKISQLRLKEHKESGAARKKSA